LTTDTIDSNGNTTSSGGVSNTYDFENRMTAHLTTTPTTMVYDGDGNRVSESVGGAATKYLVDTLNPTGLPQVLDEAVNGAVTRTYAYGLQRISENQLNGSTWTPSFYGYDGHRNVRFLTNSAGPCYTRMRVKRSPRGISSKQTLRLPRLAHQNETMGTHGTDGTNYAPGNQRVASDKATPLRSTWNTLTGRLASRPAVAGRRGRARAGRAGGSRGAHSDEPDSKQGIAN